MTRLPHSPAVRPRRGMALPMVIVVLLVLTASFAGGVALARGERSIDDAGKTNVLAQSWAETGLQRLVSDRGALGLAGQPGLQDSIRVTFSGGYYDVMTSQLRPAGVMPGLYILRSHAVITKSSVAGAPPAEYTITQLATWITGHMTVQSALTGVNGTNKSGASGTISGVDQCPVASGGSGLTIPAVAGPTTAADGGPGYDGSTAPLVGSPLVQSIGANPVAAAAAVPIDWASISSGSALTPDFISDNNGTGFPSQAWFDANPTKFPVILVQNGPPAAENEFIMSEFGRGLLIVLDNVRLNGSTAGWDGIILAGGMLRSNGSNRVQGATVSGLNTQLGYTPGPNDVNDLNGTKQFLYDSCNVKSAANSLGKLRVYKSTWFVDYKTY